MAVCKVYKCLDYLFTGLSPLLLRSMEVVVTVSLIPAPTSGPRTICCSRRHSINHLLNISSATWTCFPILQCSKPMTTVRKFNFTFCFRERFIPSAKHQKKWQVFLFKVCVPTINCQCLDSHLSTFVCEAARYPVTSTLDYFLKLLDSVLIYNLSNHELLYMKPRYTGRLLSFQRAFLWIQRSNIKYMLTRLQLPSQLKATQIPKQGVAPAFGSIPKSKLNTG